jgi:hypothetical protein
VVLSELNDTKLRDSARSAWAFETASKPGQTVVFLLPGKSSENIELQTLDYINSEPLVHHLKNTDDSKTAQSLFTSKSIDWISQNFKGLQSESNLAPHNTSTTQAQVLIFKAPFSNTTHRYKWHLYQCCTSVHKCKI